MKNKLTINIDEIITACEAIPALRAAVKNTEPDSDARETARAAVAMALRKTDGFDLALQACHGDDECPKIDEMVRQCAAELRAAGPMIVLDRMGAHAQIIVKKFNLTHIAY